MKIASRATPEGLAGHGLSTTALGCCAQQCCCCHSFWPNWFV